ncbi:MAG TPA: glycosyl hydrolase family 28 protein [Paludibacter sp.]|nr:glycosyl hydrolase family 28 protein [Paludibacter sp.]
MMKKHFFAALFLFVAASIFGQSKVVNICDLGAKSSNTTENTAIIQKAIDDISAAGGGRVVIPAGRFVTSILTLKSNVDLHLEKYAVLAGSTKRADYGPSSQASALLVADNATNISITGRGMIDGQGEALLKDIYVMLHAGTLQDKEWQTENPWHQVRPEEQNRPKIINFEHCNNVVIKGITLRNALCWVQRYNQCADMVIDSMQVESNVYWNNDGIDFVDCKNVKLTNSFFNADDDGICLKSEDRDSRCENIFVSDCVVRSSANAVKLGTASWGGFKNITIKDIKVFDTFRSAIAIECVDGGVLENIDVRNIKATNTGNAICIRLGHRNKDSVSSQLRNVHIADMEVEVPKTKPDIGYNMEGPWVRAPHNVFPSSVTGIPGHSVQNVVIENVNIVYQGGADRKVACFGLDSLAKVPEQIPNYPELSMFGELPAWGFYVRHVEGLQMKNISVSYKDEDFRPAMVFDDVKELNLNNVVVLTAKEMPVLVLRNVKTPLLEQVNLPVDNKKGILILKK